MERRFRDFFDVEGTGEIAAIAALLHPKFKKYWVQCLDNKAQNKIKELSKNLMQPESSKAQAPAINEDDFFLFWG